MKRNSYLHFTAAVIFVISGLWLGAKFFSAGSPDAAVTAEYVSVNDEITLTGTVIREEKTVCAEGDYIVIPQDGQWLCGGDTVAVGRNAASAYFDYVYSWEYPPETADIPQAVSAFLMSKNPEKRRSATASATALLYGRKKGENEHIPLPRKTVSAEAPGYFTRFTDGLESLAITDDFSKAEGRIPMGCLGKIVSGNCWYFVAEADSETVEKLCAADCISLDGYPARLAEISGEKLIFRVSRGVEAHLTDRLRSLRVSFREYSGIRLPKAAVSREKDGNYVWIQTIGGAEKTPVEIIYGAEDFLIVRGDGLSSGARVYSSCPNS